MELKSKVALVTGAGRGIGRAIALQLANAGTRVAINYNASAAAAEALVAEIAESAVRCWPLRLTSPGWRRQRRWWSGAGPVGSAGHRSITPA